MEITLEAEQILGLIINIQLDSYQRILDGGVDSSDDWFLLQFQSSSKDIEKLAKERIMKYSSLAKNKSMISLFDDIEIMVMRHILFRMEDQWLSFNANGVQDLWKIFFDIEAQRSPQIRYMRRTLKIKGYEKGK